MKVKRKEGGVKEVRGKSRQGGDGRGSRWGEWGEEAAGAKGEEAVWRPCSSKKERK